METMKLRSAPVILVADDNPAIRQTMKMVLDEEGWSVYYVEDGNAALEQALHLLPDLILLDVMMPHLDGFEVCRRLRGHAELREVPIVMVTALDDRASRLQGIEAGADDFLTKPVDLIELKARVNTILRLNRYKTLQKERAQFKWVVEQAGEGYLLLGQQDRILYANPRARSYLGLTSEQDLAAGVSFLGLTAKQFTAYPAYLWDTWPQPAKQPRFLMSPETSSSRAFWLEVNVFPGPENDSVCLVSLRNVSEAVNADQDFKKFHYLIANKLNTPLHGVYGVVELLQAAANEMPQQKVQELAQLALVSAQRLRGDVEEILNFLRASACARKGENLKLAQLPALAHRISKELGMKTAQVRIAAVVHTRNIVLAKISLELILLELFENSKKFHPQHDPQIQIVVSKLNEEMVSVQIKDDGLHLSLEQRGAIVEPYQQANPLVQGGSEGFGLGIPMVVSILQSVGGQLQVYNSLEGPGLIVEMLIPAGPEIEY